MINRRDFGLGLGSVATVGALGAFGALGAAGTASAQGKRIFRAANPVGVVDAQQAFVTCGRHPGLGYYAAENVDIEYINMSSVNQSLVSLATGQADIASLAPGVFLPAIAKEPSLDIVAAYNWLPRNANVVVVRPESPIRSIADLKGKKIGIRNQGDGGIVALQIMFAELGLPATDIDFIAVGDAGVAGTALNRNGVDAIVTYDTAAARIEAVGFPLRYLALPPAYAKLSAGWFGFRKKDVKNDRKNVVGFCRAVAKSTLFAHTNLAQAIDIHWALYPESKSKSKPDAESRREIELILGQRKENWIRRADDPDQRWGASSLDEWKRIIEIAAKGTNNPQLPQQLGDASKVFTNELVDEVNDFDKAAVVKQAREFKL